HLPYRDPRSSLRSPTSGTRLLRRQASPVIATPPRAYCGHSPRRGGIPPAPQPATPATGGTASRPPQGGVVLPRLGHFHAGRRQGRYHREWRSFQPLLVYAEIGREMDQVRPSISGNFK